MIEALTNTIGGAETQKFSVRKSSDSSSRANSPRLGLLLLPFISAALEKSS